MKITVHGTKCPQDHSCPAIDVCPTGTILQEGYGLPTIDQDKGISCMKCAKFCPMGAFEQVQN